MSFFPNKALSLLLAVVLVSTSVPFSALADGESGEDIGDPLGPTVGPEAFAVSSQDYTLLASDDRRPLSIQAAKAKITGGAITNHWFVFRGSELLVEGPLAAASGLDISAAKSEAWLINDRAPAVKMPEYGAVVRGLALANPQVVTYDQSRSFSGATLAVDRPLVGGGDLVFNGSSFRGRGLIVASGSIAFNVSQLETTENGGLVVYAEGGDIAIRGSRVVFNGVLYAPNGAVRIQAANVTLTGRIFARQIVLNGSTFELTSREDDFALLNGRAALEACWDELSEVAAELPFTDYTQPHNSAWYAQAEIALQESLSKRLDDPVGAFRLCLQAKEFLAVLRRQLVEEREALARVEADPQGDADGDGLANGWERAMLRESVSPLVRDTDRDGVPDGAEDVDRDGLTNAEEQAFGSDPMERDADGDGLTDAGERRLGTRPGQADSDGDGVPDGEETYTQTIVGPGGIEVEITAVGDIARALFVREVSAVTVFDDTYAVSGVYALESERPFERARIRIPIDRGRLGDRPIEQVRMMYFDEERLTFVPVERQGVDAEGGYVWGETDHFSLYALFFLSDLSAIWQVPFYAGDRESQTELRFLDVVFVIDSSGSMAWNDPGGIRKQAAKRFIDGLIPGSRVGVVVGDRAGVVDFDETARVVQPLTGDLEAAKAAIDRIDDVGGTNIGAGVAAANDELIRRGSDDRARVEIVLTDGEGAYDPRYTEQAAANGIVIYTVGLGESVNQALLADIAERTGGRYFHASDADDLLLVYDRIREAVTQAPDADGDGLPDSVEEQGMRVGLWYDRLVRTDPGNPDTDGDGLTDGEEVGGPIEIALFGIVYRYYPMSSDPTKVDTDDDGLTDGEEERAYGTDPLLRDTDYDTLPDGFEIRYVPPTEPEELPVPPAPSATSRDVVRTAGWRPASNEYLGDGYYAYLSPLYRDTDGDGYSDDTEVADPRLNPGIPDMIVGEHIDFRVRVPYTLSGRVHLYSPIVVEKRGILQLEPGTEIISYIDDRSGDTLRVYGTLVSGEEDADPQSGRVEFRSGLPSGGVYWRGIVAMEGAALELYHTYVVRARNGLWLNGAVVADVVGGAFGSNMQALYVARHAVESKQLNLGTAVVDVVGSYFNDTVLIENSALVTMSGGMFDDASLRVSSGVSVVQVLLNGMRFDNDWGEYNEAIFVRDDGGGAYPELYMADSTIRRSSIGLYTSGGRAEVTVVGGTIAENGIGVKAADEGYLYLDERVQWFGNGRNAVLEKAGWRTPIYLAEGVAQAFGEEVLGLLPDMLGVVRALAEGDIDLASVRAALGAMWAEYEATFARVKSRFAAVISGRATRSETIQYGRDMAVVTELLVTVRGTIQLVRNVGIRTTLAELDVERRRLLACNSFAAGTAVWTEAGEAPIETLQVGDRVLSRDERTEETAYREVVGVVSGRKGLIYELTAGGRRVQTTRQHPFWVEGRGWTYPFDLRVGDRIGAADGVARPVERVRIVTPAEPVEVYSLTVEAFHTYYVGDVGLWVHNLDCPSVYGALRREGKYSYYTNPGGYVLSWPYMREADIRQKIETYKRSSEAGKRVEAKVAEFVGGIKDVVLMGAEVVRIAEKKRAGEFDVVTQDEIIEVKKSKANLKNKLLEQIKKLTEVNNKDFMNPENKRVILYIDEPLQGLSDEQQRVLQEIRSRGVLVVNSLEELRRVLQG